MIMLYNMREYHRPTDLDEAIRLLQRPGITTVPLAGGVTVVGEGTPDIEAVVDLDGLNLGLIERDGDTIRLGAMVRLQTIVEELHDVAGGALSDTARRVAGWNVRNAATLGGLLASGDVHNPLSVMLVALGARVTVYDGKSEQSSPWSDFGLESPSTPLWGKLIIAISFEAPEQMVAAYEQVARTPADQPIVCAAAVITPATGGTVNAGLAVGGLLDTLLVLHETSTGTDIAELQGKLWQQLGDNPALQSDFRGSAEYREAVASITARRALTYALTAAGLPQ
jgi:CO/xanthine dehydrogenase FAD-binding subunit